MRVLGRIRLSRSTEESTSIERQRELIQQWADANDHTVVGWAEDIDVSGSVSPFDAPELGPWFEDPKRREWDILVAWKLDRIARRSIPLHQVFAWIQENNKTLVCVSDSIDLSNWVGRLVASVIAGVAEGELEAIRERARASQRKLRHMGRWEGGRPPYGWRGVQLDGGGYKLEHDPETYPILQRIIADFREGKSAGAIATELNAESVTTPVNHLNGRTGGTWHSQSIRRMLASRSLLGWATHEDVPVLDDDGKPILKGPPAVTGEEFEEIQTILEGRKFSKATPDRTSPLLEVLRCWECGGVMYIRRHKSGAGYYCSGGCKQISVNANTVHRLVHDMYRDELGELKVLEKVVTYATDHSAELREARAAYEETASFIASASSELRKTLFSQLEILEQRISDLEQGSVEEDTVEWLETGETYQQLWDELDDEGRRQLLIRSGITVRARQLTRGNQHRAGIMETEFRVPEPLRQRLHSAGRAQDVPPEPLEGYPSDG